MIASDTLGLHEGYKVWNTHGEQGENLPEKTIQAPLQETTSETLYQNHP